MSEHTSYQRRAHASLLLSQLSGGGVGSVLRAVTWHNLLLRLGTRLPLFLIHDLGLLLVTSVDPQQLATSSALSSQSQVQITRGLLLRYQDLLKTLLRSSVMEQLAALQLRDELVAVVLHRLLAELQSRLPRVAGAELPTLPSHWHNLGSQDGDVAGLTEGVQWLETLTAEPQVLQLLTYVELLDVQTLRLLGQGGGAAGQLLDSVESGAPDLLDLLQVLSAPGTGDIVRFALELLPQVLETRRAPGAQTFPTGGYAALLQHGSLADLLPTELAQDDDVFALRYALNELVYYGREQQRKQPQRRHYLLVDGSPSMRGLRQVFARGLALSLCKKLSLQGQAVVLRLFDGRLHERVDLARTPGRLLPYLLGFRSQRGRNYSRVFSDLLQELTAEQQSAKSPVLTTLYILTHGECHIPRQTVAALSKLATLYGVYVLPSGELQLDYLPLLHRTQIVHASELSSVKSRRQRALQIVDDVSHEAPAATQRA